MNKSSTWFGAVVAAAVGGLMVVAAAGSPRSDAGDGGGPVAGGTGGTGGVESAALSRFRAAGKGAALTVVSARLGGQTVPQVGEVVGLMLERAGMTAVETSEVAFVPPEVAGLDETARAFGEFVRGGGGGVATEYALFADFMGTPKSGVQEVRGVVVNRAGEMVWQDRQVKGDADFDRVSPREPMQCCQLLVERLRPVLGLGDPARGGTAGGGTIEKRMRAASGVADEAESAEMEKRAKVFRERAATATMVVYPAHAGDAFSVESARAISAMLNEKKVTRAAAAESGPRPVIARGMNQQKAAWSLARGLSDAVKKNPPEADYVLMADYAMSKDAVGGVQFAVCDTGGDLVIVDVQNDHWPDFKAVDPKSREDCDRLVARRIAALCK